MGLGGGDYVERAGGWVRRKPNYLEYTSSLFQVSRRFSGVKGGNDQVIENIEKIVKSKGVNGAFGGIGFLGG